MNSKEYFEATANLDMSLIYKKFRDQIPMGCMILDAGCGVGRDTRYFISHGYKTVSIDASEEMVNFCRRYPFAFCEKMSFDELPYVEEFNAVWACASLVHLSSTELRSALRSLAMALKTHGTLYFSLKQVAVGTVDSGRYFYPIVESDILDFLEKQLHMKLIERWVNQSQVQGRLDSWSNYLLNKR